MSEFSFHNPESMHRLLYKCIEYQFTVGNRFIKKFNLTVEQLALMHLLYDKDGMTQKELARSACKDQANITRIIKRLVFKKFLEIRSTATDKRLNLIYFTPKGRIFIEKVFLAVDQFSQYAAAFFPKELTDSLRKNLKKYMEVSVAHEAKCMEYIDKFNPDMDE